MTSWPTFQGRPFSETASMDHVQWKGKKRSIPTIGETFRVTKIRAEFDNEHVGFHVAVGTLDSTIQDIGHWINEACFEMASTEEELDQEARRLFGIKED